jgi:hypothetical protein
MSPDIPTQRISVDTLFAALISQGAPMVMALDDPYLCQTLGYTSITAAQKRRERGDYPPTTYIGGRVVVMLPALAAWLATKSTAPEAAAPQPSAELILASSARKPGRPRKAVAMPILVQSGGAR